MTSREPVRQHSIPPLNAFGRPNDSLPTGDNSHGGRPPAPLPDGRRQTRALGRSDTCACQRRTLRSSSGTESLAGLRKSTLTSPVMSATV